MKKEMTEQEEMEYWLNYNDEDIKKEWRTSNEILCDLAGIEYKDFNHLSMKGMIYLIYVNINEITKLLKSNDDVAKQVKKNN